MSVSHNLTRRSRIRKIYSRILLLCFYPVWLIKLSAKKLKNIRGSKFVRVPIRKLLHCRLLSGSDFLRYIKIIKLLPNWKFQNNTPSVRSWLRIHTRQWKRQDESYVKTSGICDDSVILALQFKRGLSLARKNNFTK